MDSTLMSCPTCGHSVNSSSGHCTYCGAVISQRGAKKQLDGKIAAEETPASPSEPPEQPAAMSRAAVMSEAGEKERTAAAKPPESILAPKGPAESVAAESAEPTGDAESFAEAPVTASKAAHEDTLPEKEPASATDASGLPSASDSTPEIDLTQVEAEAEPLGEHTPAGDLMRANQTPAKEKASSGSRMHQAVAAPPEDEPEPEKLSAAPAAQALDPTVAEPDEAEMLGAEIMAVIESQVSAAEKQRSKAFEGHSSGHDTAVAVRDPDADDRQPHAVQERAPEKTGSLTSDAPTETILLETADEVQISAGQASGKAIEKIKMAAAKPNTAAKAGSDAAAESPERPPDTLKTENAALKTAAVNKNQTETLAAVDNSKDEKAEKAKIQALKRQKAALAKAQAHKKQQLLLAKAAALKRKKAAEAEAQAGAANAQAINKKRAAAAGEPTPKIEDAAAGAPQKGASAAIGRDLEVNSKLQELLKKYSGKAIGINYDNSVEIREALLEKANNEYFSVFVKDKKLHYSYPLKTILAIIEGPEGVDAGNSKQPKKFNAVIKVYPLVLF